MSGKSLGTRCSCGEGTVVIDSRTNVTGVIRRRRKCPKCDERFTTYEDRRIKGGKDCVVIVCKVKEDGRVDFRSFDFSKEDGDGSGLMFTIKEGEFFISLADLRKAS